MIECPGNWVRGNEHRLLAPFDRQKSTLSIVGIEAEGITKLVGASLLAMAVNLIHRGALDRQQAGSYTSSHIS
jgi:hypothetical protein